MSPRPWSLLLLSLGACDRGGCPDLSGLEGVDAVVDGAAWQSSGQWFAAGDSLQIVTDLNDGWRLSMVAQQTDDGQDIMDALYAGAFPLQVALTVGTEGGWALLYPDEGDSWATQEGGDGLLTLAAMDDHLQGCFSFQAQRDDEWITVDDGRLVIPEL